MNRSVFTLSPAGAAFPPQRVAGDEAAPADGDALLAKAVATSGLRSYVVPVRWDVHMVRPVGVRAGVDGATYYQAPARAVLVLKSLPPRLKRFFRSSYELDMVPQTWPAEYRVSAVEARTVDGVDAYVLTAVPKAADIIDRVTIVLRKADLAPTSADWHYQDGKSGIRLRLAGRKVDRYALPSQETLTVAQPGFALQAEGSYGDYALNATVPDDVFKSGA